MGARATAPVAVGDAPRRRERVRGVALMSLKVGVSIRAPQRHCHNVSIAALASQPPLPVKAEGATLLGPYQSNPAERVGAGATKELRNAANGNNIDI